MKQKRNRLVLVILLALFNSITFASNISGEEELAILATPGDPGVDPGATPINDFIFPMLLLGVLVGYQLTKLDLKEKDFKK